MEKTNAITKNSELSAILETHFKEKINLARIKFMAHFITSLCKLRTVNFEMLANGFVTGTKKESSLRRIQRFIAEYAFDRDIIARLVFNLLPQQDDLTLTIDRTNWKFGQANINIFMLGIVYQGVAFPLLFSMLPKRGNSNTKERIELIERFINLFGKERIECLVADREFVGRPWLEYLNHNNIRYHIRIRNNFKVFLPHKQKEIKAEHLFHNLSFGAFKYYEKIVRVNGELCYLSGQRTRDKKGRPEFLILVSFNKPQESQCCYAQRWQIEMCFKAMKSSGFDLERTHLQDPKRIEKLILLIMVAFTWCYKIGIYLHENVMPIKVKPHGRKAKSIFRYGLDYLNNLLLNTDKQDDISIFKFLSCT